MELTQVYLKEIFTYSDGFLFWKIRMANRIKTGDKAGYLHEKRGGFRRVIRINKKLYYSSRLIFLWHNGIMPLIVDHKDLNTQNDKIENLRSATNSENQRNKKSSINSTSKYLGVNFHKTKWRAAININGKPIHLGLFIKEIDAAKAYNTAAIKHHKEFANLNVVDME